MVVERDVQINVIANDTDNVLELLRRSHPVKIDLEVNAKEAQEDIEEKQFDIHINAKDVDVNVIQSILNKHKFYFSPTLKREVFDPEVDNASKYLEDKVNDISVGRLGDRIRGAIKYGIDSAEKKVDIDIHTNTHKAKNELKDTAENVKQITEDSKSLKEAMDAFLKDPAKSAGKFKNAWTKQFEVPLAIKVVVEQTSLAKLSTDIQSAIDSKGCYPIKICTEGIREGILQELSKGIDLDDIIHLDNVHIKIDSIDVSGAKIVGVPSGTMVASTVAAAQTPVTTTPTVSTGKVVGKASTKTTATPPAPEKKASEIGVTMGKVGNTTTSPNAQPKTEPTQQTGVIQTKNPKATSWNPNANETLPDTTTKIPKQTTRGGKYYVYYYDDDNNIIGFEEKKALTGQDKSILKSIRAKDKTRHDEEAQELRDINEANYPDVYAQKRGYGSAEELKEAFRTAGDTTGSAYNEFSKDRGKWYRSIFDKNNKVKPSGITKILDSLKEAANTTVGVQPVPQKPQSQPVDTSRPKKSWQDERAQAYEIDQAKSDTLRGEGFTWYQVNGLVRAKPEEYDNLYNTYKEANKKRELLQNQEDNKRTEEEGKKAAEKQAAEQRKAEHKRTVRAVKAENFKTLPLSADVEEPETEEQQERLRDWLKSVGVTNPNKIDEYVRSDKIRRRKLNYDWGLNSKFVTDELGTVADVDPSILNMIGYRRSAKEDEEVYLEPITYDTIAPLFDLIGNITDNSNLDRSKTDILDTVYDILSNVSIGAVEDPIASLNEAVDELNKDNTSDELMQVKGAILRLLGQLSVIVREKTVVQETPEVQPEPQPQPQKPSGNGLGVTFGTASQKPAGAPTQKQAEEVKTEASTPVGVEPIKEKTLNEQIQDILERNPKLSDTETRAGNANDMAALTNSNEKFIEQKRTIPKTQQRLDTGLTTSREKNITTITNDNDDIRKLIQKRDEIVKAGGDPSDIQKQLTEKFQAMGVVYTSVFGNGPAEQSESELKDELKETKSKIELARENALKFGITPDVIDYLLGDEIADHDKQYFIDRFSSAQLPTSYGKNLKEMLSMNPTVNEQDDLQRFLRVWYTRKAAETPLAPQPIQDKQPNTFEQDAKKRSDILFNNMYKGLNKDLLNDESKEKLNIWHSAFSDSAIRGLDTIPIRGEILELIKSLGGSHELAEQYADEIEKLSPKEPEIPIREDVSKLTDDAFNHFIGGLKNVPKDRIKYAREAHDNIVNDIKERDTTYKRAYTNTPDEGDRDTLERISESYGGSEELLDTYDKEMSAAYSRPYQWFNGEENAPKYLSNLKGNIGFENYSRDISSKQVSEDLGKIYNKYIGSITSEGELQQLIPIKEYIDHLAESSIAVFSPHEIQHNLAKRNRVFKTGRKLDKVYPDGTVLKNHEPEYLPASEGILNLSAEMQSYVDEYKKRNFVRYAREYMRNSGVPEEEIDKELLSYNFNDSDFEFIFSEREYEENPVFNREPNTTTHSINSYYDKNKDERPTIGSRVYTYSDYIKQHPLVPTVTQSAETPLAPTTGLTFGKKKEEAPANDNKESSNNPLDINAALDEITDEETLTVAEEKQLKQFKDSIPSVPTQLLKSYSDLLGKGIPVNFGGVNLSDKPNPALLRLVKKYIDEYLSSLGPEQPVVGANNTNTTNVVEEAKKPLGVTFGHVDTSTQSEPLVQPEPVQSEPAQPTSNDSRLDKITELEGKVKDFSSKQNIPKGTQTHIDTLKKQIDLLKTTTAPIEEITKLNSKDFASGKGEALRNKYSNQQAQQTKSTKQDSQTILPEGYLGSVNSANTIDELLERAYGILEYYESHKKDSTKPFDITRKKTLQMQIDAAEDSKIGANKLTLEDIKKISAKKGSKFTYERKEPQDRTNPKTIEPPHEVIKAASKPLSGVTFGTKEKTEEPPLQPTTQPERTQPTNKSNVEYIRDAKDINDLIRIAKANKHSYENEWKDSNKAPTRIATLTMQIRAAEDNLKGLNKLSLQQIKDLSAAKGSKNTYTSPSQQPVTITPIGVTPENTEEVKSVAGVTLGTKVEPLQTTSEPAQQSEPPQPTDVSATAIGGATDISDLLVRAKNKLAELNNKQVLGRGDATRINTLTMQIQAAEDSLKNLHSYTLDQIKSISASPSKLNVYDTKTHTLSNPNATTNPKPPKVTKAGDTSGNKTKPTGVTFGKVNQTNTPPVATAAQTPTGTPQTTAPVVNAAQKPVGTTSPKTKKGKSSPKEPEELNIPPAQSVVSDDYFDKIRSIILKHNGGNEEDETIKKLDEYRNAMANGEMREFDLYKLVNESINKEAKRNSRDISVEDAEDMFEAFKTELSFYDAADPSLLDEGQMMLDTYKRNFGKGLKTKLDFTSLINRARKQQIEYGPKVYEENPLQTLTDLTPIIEEAGEPYATMSWVSPLKGVVNARNTISSLDDDKDRSPDLWATMNSPAQHTATRTYYRSEDDIAKANALLDQAQQSFAVLGGVGSEAHNLFNDKVEAYIQGITNELPRLDQSINQLLSANQREQTILGKQQTKRDEDIQQQEAILNEIGKLVGTDPNDTRSKIYTVSEARLNAAKNDANIPVPRLGGELSKAITQDYNERMQQQAAAKKPPVTTANVMNAVQQMGAYTHQFTDIEVERMQEMQEMYNDIERIYGKDHDKTKYAGGLVNLAQQWGTSQYSSKMKEVHAQATFDELSGKKNGKEKVSIIDDLRKFFKNPKEALASSMEASKSKVWGGFTTAAKLLPATLFMGLIGGLVNLIKKGFTSIFDLGKKVVLTTLKPLTAMFKGFKTIIHKAISESKTLTNMMELVVMPFLLIVEFTLLPVLLSLIPVVQKMVEWTVENKDNLMEIGEKIGEIAVALADDLLGALDKLDFDNGIDGFINSILDSLTGLLVKISEKVDTFYHDHQEVIDTSIGKIIDAVLTVALNYIKTGSELVDEIVDGLLVKVNTILKDSDLTDTVTAVENIVKKLIELATDVLTNDTVMTCIVDLMVEIFKAMGSVAGEAFSRTLAGGGNNDAYVEAKSTSEEIAEKRALFGDSKEVYNLETGKVSYSAGVTEDEVKKALQEIKYAADSASYGVVPGLNQIMFNITADKIRQLINDATGKSVTVLGNVEDGITGYMDDATGYTYDLLGNLKTASELTDAETSQLDSDYLEMFYASPMYQTMQDYYDEYQETHDPFAYEGYTNAIKSLEASLENRMYGGANGNIDVNIKVEGKEVLGFESDGKFYDTSGKYLHNVNVTQG